MNKKKLLAVLCTCALLFALAVPAFASGAMTNGTETVFEGADTENDPNLTVSVSVLKGANKLYVNPYGLPYTIKNGTAQDAGGTATGESIKEGVTTDGWFSTTSVIKNETETALKVSVTMKSEEKTANVKVVTGKTAANPAFNCLWGNLQIAPAEYNSSTKLITPDWDSKEEVSVPTADNPITDPADTHFTLAGGTPGEDNLGQPITVPAYAAFRIRGGAKLGSASASGGDASDGSASGWGKNDLVDVTVAFSFEPADGSDAP